MPIIELPDIVQSLQNKQWTGTLQIISELDGRQTWLFFRGGMIQHSRPDRNPMVLGRALYEMGTIDEADYVMTLMDFDSGGRPFGQALVEMGLVSEQEIRSALNFQGREHVLDVFTWKNVDVKFHAGEDKVAEVFSEEARQHNLNIAGMGILMQAAQRQDELGTVLESLPSPWDVAVTPHGGPLEPGHLDPRITLLFDGYRSVQEVGEHAPMDTLEVLKVIAELVQNGQLRLISPDELLAIAGTAEQDADHEKALGTLELVLARGQDSLDLQRRIARLYSALGKRQAALERWLQLAERCSQENRLDLAISAIQDALELDAEDIALRHRLVKLLIDSGAQGDAVQHLRKVVDLAEGSELPRETVVEYMGELLELEPNDKEILERVAQVQLGLDNRLEAMVHLDELATVLLSEERPDEAVAVYYRILDIDAENLQARLLLAQTLANLGSTDDAVREYRRLADILFKSGVIGNSINWPFLIKVYESIVELEPSSTPAWEWLAKAYLENDQKDLAISRYLGMADSFGVQEGETPPPAILQPLRRVIELAPERLDVRHRLAQTHLALSQVERAVRCLREMAQEALRQQQVDAARQAYQEALQHVPFDMDSRRGLAGIHEQLGETKQAFERWRAIGGMCARAGLFDEARRDYERAYKLNKAHAQTLFELAEVEEERGQQRNAAMLFTRYAQLMLQDQNNGIARASLERATRLEPNLPQAAQLMSRLPPPA